MMICLLALAFCVFGIFKQTTAHTSHSYADLRDLILSEQVDEIVVDDGSVTLALKKPLQTGETEVSFPLYSFELFYQDFNQVLQEQKDSGVLKDYDYPDKPSPAWMGTLLTWIVIFAVMAVVWYFFYLRRAQQGGGPSPTQFGKARTRTLADTGRTVTFQDVAGADEEKEELQEVVEFLREPARFTQLGARIPKGVLLVGPPGTGKTLLARAVAGEAGCQFLSISGSDFVELYVGVGASRVRDLFSEAKKSSPAIVFIDEIDAVGRQRGTGLGGGHDEREQTLNQLLVEMDGFATNEGVIVMAATNRADILDPALLRPGRFDRQIYVGLPDIKGREAILRVHAKNKPLAEDVNLHTVAQATAGFTGADLAHLLNEAALLSARPQRPSIRIDLPHEAGHAVVIHHLESQDPVHQITIIPRGPAGGMTISLPEEDKMYQSRRELTERICSLLGGRVAEELVLGDISTGASNDLQNATAIARSMVTKYGMSEKLGAISYDSDQEVFIGRSMSQTRAYSEEVAGRIDQEIKNLLDGEYRHCREILKSHMDELERTAQYLLEFETMSADDFALVFGDPAKLEARKEEQRALQKQLAEEAKAEAARKQAEAEAREAQRLREADEALRRQQEETKARDPFAGDDDGPSDPFA